MCKTEQGIITPVSGNNNSLIPGWKSIPHVQILRKPSRPLRAVLDVFPCGLSRVWPHTRFCPIFNSKGFAGYSRLGRRLDSRPIEFTECDNRNRPSALSVAAKERRPFIRN
jgi:hypothetical protein